MTDQYDYYKYRDRERKIAEVKQAMKEGNEQLNQLVIAPKQDLSNTLDKNKTYRDNLLTDAQYSNQATPKRPLMFKSEEQIKTEESIRQMTSDHESLDSMTIIANGQFRFNDQVLNIPPEQISIQIDEYENTLLLMREETPIAAQSGRKRIRIIVNFPVDVSSGWGQLAKIVTQIKKTPIATIENEKIRKELFGGLKNTTNIGVVVDNLNGYVEEDYPTLIRCTLQMSWFNHAPYVEELKYLEEFDGVLKKQNMPSSKFKQFYLEGTSYGENLGKASYKEVPSLSNRLMKNDPSNLRNVDSLIVMYKEYREFTESITKEKTDSRSALNTAPTIASHRDFEFRRELEAEGWYLAEEDQDKLGDIIDGVFYRWRKFEIPFTDIDSSGALILQNISFSLSTNPSYISMEKYSIPTVQFLGGSSSDIRAIVFAAGEHASVIDKTPVQTSKKLEELQSIIKRVSEDRIKYSKYSKENHLLISHPIAKLLKYRNFASLGGKYFYVDEREEAQPFNIDYFLPVIVSSNNSSTIPGLPYASKIQLDFKETRLAKRPKYIKYTGETGSNSNKNTQVLLRKIITILYNNNGISLNKNQKFEQAYTLSNKGTPESIKGASFCEALNALRFFDKTVVDLDTAFNSLVFKANNRRLPLLAGAEESLSISELKVRRGRGQETQTVTEIFRPDWLEQFILALYVDFTRSLYSGESWTESYIELFEKYTSAEEKAYQDLYPDMMLPSNEITPSFYFADNSHRNKTFKSNILRNMPDNYKNLEVQIQDQLLNKNFVPGGNKALMASSTEGFAPAYNFEAIKGQGAGAARLHLHNDTNFRVLATQQAITDATPPTYTLAQAYPTFKIQIMSPQYSLSQELSAEDLKINELSSEVQFDLLDVFDLSSILDIRIIKDEYEAADVMVIRIANTHKTAMTREGKDPTYNAKTYSLKDAILGALDGKTTAAVVNNNLEDIGIKEGIRIRAYLGNSNMVDELGLEFQGRVASVNGKDIIEIYCVSDGHELIQNTYGYKGEEEDREYSFNSETVDLIGKLISTTDEVKSFGNTRFEIIKNVGLKLPSFMGGISALDNIYAPKMQPGSTIGSFATDALSSSLKTYGNIYGIGAVLGGAAATTAFFGSVGLPILGALAIGTMAEAWKVAKSAMSPCPFTVYQQTVWDVLQELTLRHPGYICAIVPFDNRATIYFGEPDGTFFCRGVRTASEKAMKAAASKSGITLSNRATLREIYDNNSSILKSNPKVSESSYPFLDTNAKTRQNAMDKLLNGKTPDTEMLTLAAMQKSFRNYHLITSENDIISNDIQASAVDVGNSVQVYHPSDSGDASHDGTTWFSKYELTSKMKADDDLHSNLINNKVFTFHNAHREYKEMELPERYAMGILCKELENIYKGRITILGRKGIKPHDIVILSDTHNKISGPVKVGRVMHQISTQSGWVTHVYPKFIAIPNSSAGTFQMKAVLKAARYWLGTHTDLFYSNMDKFIPDETADSGKQIREMLKAYQMGFNNPTYHTEEEITKEIAIQQGEHSIFENAGVATSGGLDAALFAGAQHAGNKLSGLNPDNATQYLKVQGKRITKEGKKLGSVTKGALEARKIGGGIDVGWQAAKSSVNVAKVAGRTLFSTALGFGGGFVIEHLFESAIDGLLSYLKYRQPISIFPLTKDGKPWMAALNGYKENSVMEHLEENSMKAADKLGMTMYLAKKWYEEWSGDTPANIGYTSIVEVVTEPSDGDTIKIQNNDKQESIRILGYDTGELKSYGGTQEGGEYEKKLGEMARDELRKLIKDNDNKVEIIRHGKDDYGRTLAKVKVSGIDVAEYMKNNYLAMNYPKGTVKDWSASLPPRLKNDPKAIADIREAEWKRLYEKRQQKLKLRGEK